MAMTGRDLIVYILQNNMENDLVFDNGRFLGFMTLEEFSKKQNVGPETVRLWIDLKYLDAIIIYDEIYIPHNAEVKHRN